jgi:Transposase, Mutator family
MVPDWYLINLACFSLISVVSRSPTMRCGSCRRLMAVAMISSKAAFFHSRESIGQRRVEDVDHLSIAVIDAGKLAPYALQRRGLRGVKLVISDAHEGIRAAVSRFG